MLRNKSKIIRTSTIPASFFAFVEGSITSLMDKYDLILLSSPGKELVEMNEKYGVKTIAVPMERHISISNDLKSLMILIKVFYKEKPCMVHSMTPKAGLLCMIAAWICRVPRRVHTFTGLVWPTAVGLKRKILMTTDWITCACATHVIPEGEGVKNDLQEHITKKSMKVLGYGNVRGVDMDYWKRSEAVNHRADELKMKGSFTFLFVGRLVGDKGINELLEAFVKLIAKHDNIRLFLVGPYENDLDPLKKITCDRIKHTSGVKAVGDTHGIDLLAYYAASDCFVFPSYREGFPNTVLEAGAMGLPQIVTDINGSREIITGNESRMMSHESELSLRDNGIVIPSKNVDALYESMKMMIENKEMRTRMANNARKMIETRFEKNFVQGCQMAFYDEIMK